MTIATGLLIDNLCLRLVVAVDAGIVVHDLEGWRPELAMTLVTIHFIIRNVDIVAEFQVVFFFVAPNQAQQKRTGSQDNDGAVDFHSRTSTDVRTR